MKTQKIERKILSFILTTVIIVVTSVICVHAETTKEYEYEVKNGVATITKYIGSNENVVIPSVIDGYNVKTVEFEAFRNDNAKNIKTVVVSEGIENVVNWLFTSCQKLESITLPSTVKELATDWFFIGSSTLRELKFSGENSRYYTDNGVLYDSQNKQLMLCPAQNNFENSEYKILDGTIDIRSWAFTNCETIKKVIMPDSVKTIGDSAFSDCSNIKELVLSDNINYIGYNAFGGLSNLKVITIPKTVTGLYRDGQTANTQLGYIGSEKVEDFTIKGYKNSEAEKYAKDNDFIFIPLDEEIDYSKYNPIDFLGMSFQEITSIFGNDYKEVTENGSGLTKYIYYPNTGNPFEFGFDYNTNRVIAIYVYDLSETPIKLFDNITNKSLLSDIENSKTAYPYTKSYDYTSDSDIICYSLENNKIIKLEWINNDMYKQSADRVLVFQKKSEEETTTKPKDTESATNATNNNTTKPSVNPTSSTDATSKVSTPDTATNDSLNGNNGSIQTGVVLSVVIIALLLMASLSIGGFAWYSRKRDKK